MDLGSTDGILVHVSVTESDDLQAHPDSSPTPTSPPPPPTLLETWEAETEPLEEELNVQPEPSGSEHDDVDENLETTSDAEGRADTESSEVEVRKRLIAEVEKYPNIWKYAHPNYRHWGLTQESWEQIAIAVAMPLEECRQIWNGIRSRYATNRNLSEKTKSRLRYFKDLHFLEENFEKYTRNNFRKFDDMNYTDIFDPEFAEHSEQVDFNESIQGHFLSGLESEEGDTKRILLDKLRTYNKFEKLCILCNRKSKYEDKLFHYIKKNKKSNTIIKDWKHSTAISLCEVIGLDTNNYVEYFAETVCCKSCYQLMLDVEYWSKSIKSLQHKLDNAKRQIDDILIDNNSTPHGPPPEDEDYVGTEGEDNKDKFVIKIKEEFRIRDHEVVSDSASRNPLESCDDAEENDNEEEAEAYPDSDTKETVKLTKTLKKWKRHKKEVQKKKSEQVRTRSGRIVIKRELSSEEEQEEFEPKVEDSSSVIGDNFIIPDDFDSPPRKRRKVGFRKKKKQKPKSVARPRHFCPEAGCTFSSRTEFLLLVHINKDHRNDPNPYHCDTEECEDKFPTIDSLNDHKVNVHGGNPVIESHTKPCKYCGKIFNTTSGLNQHYRVNHSAYQLKPKCRFCAKSFGTEEEVAEHEDLHNLEIINRFVCILCENAMFQSQLDLQRHVQMEHEPELFKCHPCNLVFLTEMRLKSHRYIHHSHKSKETFKCDHCGFQAKTPSALRDHSQKHGLNTHRCNEPGCSAAYKWKSALKRHLQSAHTKEKPWECPLCGKSFYTASDLRRHEVYHLDLRPFMCEFCPSQFKQQKHLQRHMKLHEKAGSESVKPQTPRRGRLKTYLAQAQGTQVSEIPIEVEVPIVMHNEEVIEEGEVIIPITMDENNQTFTATTMEGIPVIITYADNGNIITLQTESVHENDEDDE